jgi:hypothetical protein
VVAVLLPALVATTLAVIITVVTPTPLHAVPTDPQYAKVFEVNSMTFYDANAYCVDKNDPAAVDEVDTGRCTLRQALVQANAAGGDGAVLVTVDTEWAEGADASGKPNVDPKQPWIRASSGDSEGTITGMCLDCALYNSTNANRMSIYGAAVWNRTAGWVNVAGDYHGYFYVSRHSVTIDLKGKIGIAPTGDNAYFAALVIAANNVTVRNVNGLYSAETAVVVKSGVSGFTLANGITDQAHAPYVKGSDGNLVGTAFLNTWFTERFLMVQGAVINLTLANWQIGGIYGGYDRNYGGVVFYEPDVKTIRFNGVSWNSSVTGLCLGDSGTGCAANGITSITDGRISDVQFTDCEFKSFKSPYPISLDRGVKLSNWDFGNTVFTDIVLSSGLQLGNAELENFDLNGIRVQDSQISASFLSTSGRVVGLSVRKATIKNNTFDVAFIQLTGAVERPVKDGEPVGYGILMDGTTVTDNSIGRSFLWMQDNTASGIKVTGTTFIGNYKMSRGLFGMRNVTVDGAELTYNTFRHNGNKPSGQGGGSIEAYYGLVFAHRDGKATNITVTDNVTIGNGKETGTNWHAMFTWYNLSQLQKLNFKNNISTGTYVDDGGVTVSTDGDSIDGEYVWTDVTSSSVGDLVFESNTFENLRLRRRYGDYGGQVFSLPDRVIQGRNAIANNVVSLRGDNIARFVDWEGGGKSNSDSVSSSLTITDNKLSGFGASAIRIAGQGLTEIRRNTFNSVSSQSTGESEESESNNSAYRGYMVHNRAGSNQQIKPWYPTGNYVFDSDKCTLNVEVGSGVNGVTDSKDAALPVTLDFFATASDDAEIYLDAGTVSTGTLPITASVTIDASKLWGTSGMRLRMQTTQKVGDAYGSSQFSRWITLGAIACDAKPVVQKVAYADAEYTQVLADSAVVQLGDVIHWSYIVTNTATIPINVTIADDKKLDGPVCELQIKALTQATCFWQQTMSLDVMSDG